MNVFEGIEDVSAEGTSNRQYFEPGKYVVEIDRVFLHEKRLGGGKLFIVETTVKESDNLNIKPGEQRNWVQRLDNDYAKPRIKSFIGAALGMCPRKQLEVINTRINSEICNKAIGENNPLAGKKLSLTCLNKVTKAGRNFTHPIWGVVNG